MGSHYDNRDQESNTVGEVGIMCSQKFNDLPQVTCVWMFRNRSQLADAIQELVDLGEQSMDFSEMETDVVCAIACHQLIDPEGLLYMFGKEIGRNRMA